MAKWKQEFQRAALNNLKTLHSIKLSAADKVQGEPTPDNIKFILSDLESIKKIAEDTIKIIENGSE